MALFKSKELATLKKEVAELKTLQTKAVKFFADNIPVNTNGFSGFISNSDTSNLGLIRTAESTPDIFQITDYVATIISNLPIKIIKPNGEPSKNVELARLVKQPNYYQNWNELIKQFAAYYELLGNGYLYSITPEGMRTISSLFVLPTQAVGVVLLMDKRQPNWMNEVYGYQVEIGGYKYNLPKESVLHKRYFNYQFEEGAYIYGMSKYIPGNTVANELKAIYEAKTSIIGNRGIMGILSNESNVPDPEQTALIQDKIYEYGLGTGLNKIAATTQKLSYIQLALGLDELKIIENAKYSFETLCRLNGFDPVIFSTEGSTFANKKEARKDAIKNVIKPKVDDIYNDLNEWLSPFFGGDRIEPDWSMVEELQADIKALTEICKLQWEFGVLTPKEAYKIIWNKEPENPEISDEYKGQKEEPKEEPKPEDDLLNELLKTPKNGNSTKAISVKN